MTPMMQVLYFWICEHIDENGYCFPSRKTLAIEAGINIKSVDKYLPVLEAVGLITKITRKNETEYLSNAYQVNILLAPNSGLPSPSQGATPSPQSGALTDPILNRPISSVLKETENFSFEEEMQEQGYYLDASDVPNRDDVYPKVWYTQEGKRLKDGDFKTLLKNYNLRNKPQVVKSIPASVNVTNNFLTVYADYCQEYAGVTPQFNTKDKIIVANALKKHGIENIGAVALWYLQSDTEKSKKVNVQSAVSTYTINQYLAKTGNKLKANG